MTYYVVFNNQTNNVVDICDTPPPTQESHITIKSFPGDVPDLYYYKWDVESSSHVLRVDANRLITVHEFLNRLTAIERINIKTAALTDPALSDYMDMLYQATGVDLSDPLLYGGLQYLVYLGLLEPYRITELLS